MRLAGLFAVSAIASASLSLLAPPRATAQTATDHVSMGATAAEARDPHTAYRHFEAALSIDPSDYAANWRGALALIDVGKQIPDSVESPQRDSLYALAETLARQAVAANDSGPDGYFVLANAIGRTSLTKSKKERIRRASEIRTAALRAIELDSLHDGAYHVMGRWHAEIMRLSGLSRFFAKSFLGAGVFNQASWAGATSNLEKAVEIAPDNIYHRLDLARVYIDRERWADARGQLERVAPLPVVDVMDAAYKQEATELLRRIADEE